MSRLCSQMVRWQLTEPNCEGHNQITPRSLSYTECFIAGLKNHLGNRILGHDECYAARACRQLHSWYGRLPSRETKQAFIRGRMGQISPKGCQRSDKARIYETGVSLSSIPAQNVSAHSIQVPGDLWYDGYHALDDFREQYERKYNKKPYVSPVVRNDW